MPIYIANGTVSEDFIGNHHKLTELQPDMWYKYFTMVKTNRCLKLYASMNCAIVDE
jgi:hypothetical protein